MLMNDSTSAAMPCREQHTTMAAVLLDVLETSDHIRDTADEEAAADYERPGTVRKSVSVWPLIPRAGPRSDKTYCVVFPE